MTLNCLILEFLFHDVYTSIIAVTLWTISLMDESLWWRVDYLITGITGGINTIPVNITIIWHCWVLWDCQCVPVMKAMQILSDLQGAGDVESTMIYTLMLIMYLALEGRNTMAAYYADIVVAYVRAIALTLLVLCVAAGSMSISSDEESNTSRNISDINFRPMGENSSSSNPSDKSFSGSLRTHS
ncbi:hypothetical protein ARMGADRAFT_1028378 [Armillaria gallica]|uniref:Uncharacterized protein n=1 Tax=Armillaria gallica TaxID=47427 RepID=A0A2H3DXM3_ARMGA|nr:hypothetical protein ARMGADRAFT_1028378 [Armillaria gallica]